MVGLYHFVYTFKNTTILSYCNLDRILYLVEFPSVLK